MGAAPQGPGDDGGGLDLAVRQARSHPADFLHRPVDQCWLLRIIRRLLFGGAGMLALRRIAASIAKASMTSETCRCQPGPFNSCGEDGADGGAVVRAVSDQVA